MSQISKHDKSGLEENTEHPSGQVYLTTNVMSNALNTPYQTFQSMTPEMYESTRTSSLSHTGQPNQAHSQTKILEKVSQEGSNKLIQSLSSESSNFENRWIDVKKYCDTIRKFANEASIMELSRENYYDLYTLAVCLVKSVDGLDPDKGSTSTRRSEFDLNTSVPQLIINPIVQGLSPDFDPRKSFEYYRIDPSLMSKYPSESPTMYYNSPVTGPNFLNPLIASFPKGKNHAEAYFDDLSPDDSAKRQKRVNTKTKTIIKYSLAKAKEASLCPKEKSSLPYVWRYRNSRVEKRTSWRSYTL